MTSASRPAHAAGIASRAVDQAAQTDDTVQGLAGSAGQIGEVVGFINTIAAQTNLLALNATIEAAPRRRTRFSSAHSLATTGACSKRACNVGDTGVKFSSARLPEARLATIRPSAPATISPLRSVGSLSIDTGARPA